jgi:hypothetical protein
MARQRTLVIRRLSERRAILWLLPSANLYADFTYLLPHAAVGLLIDDGATIEQVADLLGDDPRTLYRRYRHKVQAIADAGLRMEQVPAL